MAPATSSRYCIPDEDLDPQDPFYSLLLDWPDLPRLRHASQNTKYWFSEFEGMNHWIGCGEIERVIRWKLPHREGVVIIEAIDDKAICLLKEVFPDLDLKFLHQHAVRSETPQVPHSETGGLRDFVSVPRLTTDSESSDGVHFDIFCTVKAKNFKPDAIVECQGGAELAFSISECAVYMNERSYRTEKFISDGSTWRRASTRISCCVLKPGLYLVLVDAPLGNHLKEMDNRFGVSHDLVLPGDTHHRPDLPNKNIFSPGEALNRALGSFNARSVADFMSGTPTGFFQQLTFHTLLVVSEWHCLLDQSERDLRIFRSRATNSLEKSTLDDMSAFRRTLADTRELIADTDTNLTFWKRSRIGLHKKRAQPTTRSPNASLDTTNPSTHPGTVITDVDMETINLSALIDQLAKFEARLEVITKAVNEEVQLFIASISIRDSEVMLTDSRIMREDSKVMREDSQIMKQQAARTTLLTTLAVIYLPLQLITGIFGMNLKEINGGGPNWWACLATLGVGGILTFLVYLGVKWWQWRNSLRKKRDAEKEKDV